MQAPLAAHREFARQHAGDDALGGLAAGRVGKSADRGEGLLQDGARLGAAPFERLPAANVAAGRARV